MQENPENRMRRDTGPLLAPEDTPGITRFVDVHVYDLPEQRELPAEPHTEQQGQHDEIAPIVAQEAPPSRRPRLLLQIGLAIVCILCIGIILVVSILSLFTATASVTIIPVSEQVRLTYTLMIVPDGKQSTAQKIPGRPLAQITLTQKQSGKATGRGHQEARAAQGAITLYNAAPYAQTIPAGTLLTSASGVQILTNEDALIPPVDYPTFGQTSVNAHASIRGPEGNIQARTIYGPCCSRLHVSAVNGPFQGGEEAREYQSVTQADIDTITKALKTSLEQNVAAAMQAQLQPDETLIPPICTPSMKPDKQPGTEATQVHITASVTCNSLAYKTAEYHTLIEQVMTQEATTRLGNNYKQAGMIQSETQKATPKEHDQRELQIQVTGTWVYQFTAQEQTEIKSRVAGKSKEEATSILLATTGVQTVSMSISNASSTLPHERNAIHLIIILP